MLLLLYLESVMMFLGTSAWPILFMTFVLILKLQRAEAFVCLSPSAQGIVAIARLEPKVNKSLPVSLRTIF